MWQKLNYYISSLTVFNLLYYIILTANYMKNGTTKIDKIFYIINSVLVVFLVIWGLVYNIVIRNTDYSCNEGETGKIAYIIDKKDETINEFFSKFSLLILTGITIANIPSYYGTLAYLIFVISIGIIYIRKNMMYLNLFLVMLGYDIYQVDCTIDGNIESKKYYFIVRNMIINVGETIEFTDTDNNVIRLNGNMKKVNKNESNN